jgi:hypothetical protein
MVIRILALASCVLLFGCATGGPGMRAFDSVTGQATTCSGPCDIEVQPSACFLAWCGGKVQYDPIYVDKPNVPITFNLPEGYGFCRQRGDGVFLKSEDSDEFESDPSNGQGPACKRWFKLIDKNHRPRPDTPYSYKVLFTRTSDGQQHKIDPSFINK